MLGLELVLQRQLAARYFQGHASSIFAAAVGHTPCKFRHADCYSKSVCVFFRDIEPPLLTFS